MDLFGTHLTQSVVIAMCKTPTAFGEESLAAFYVTSGTKVSGGSSLISQQKNMTMLKESREKELLTAVVWRTPTKACMTLPLSLTFAGTGERGIIRNRKGIEICTIREWEREAKLGKKVM